MKKLSPDDFAVGLKITAGEKRYERTMGTDKEAGMSPAEDFLDLFYNVNERAPKGSNPFVWVIPYELAASNHADAQALIGGAS